MIYREQLQTILNWSGGWSSAEQICAISTLFTVLSETDKKFVGTIVVNHKSTDDDVKSLEGAANNSLWVERLQEEPPSVIAQGLLEHLPLAKNNYVQAGLYMPLIHKLLSHVLNTDDLLEDARNILAFALMHPMFSEGEYKSDIISYIQRLQSKMMKNYDSDTSSVISTADFNYSESITSFESDQCNDADFDDKNTFLEQDSGMQDVPKWLKSLRLHKYQSLFAKLTYDEMLNLDEDKLQDVTKGARNKILDNIVKLRERYNTLVDIRNELDKNSDIQAKQLTEYLQTLKVMIVSPMRVQFKQEKDIPLEYTKTLGKIYNQLHKQLYNPAYVDSRGPRMLGSDEDNLTLFLSCADMAMKNPCFRNDEIDNIKKWHEIIQTSYYRYVPKLKKSRSTGLSNHRRNQGQNQSGSGSGNRNSGSHRNSSSRINQSRNNHSHQRSVPNPAMNYTTNWNLQNSPSQQFHNYSSNTLSPPQSFHKRASSFDPHLIQRTSSYNSPESSLGRSRLFEEPMPGSSGNASDRLDINSRLDRDMKFS